MEYTIENCQKLVDEWIKTVGVRLFFGVDEYRYLDGRGWEMARIMARRYGDQSFKASDREVDLAEEMADVLFVLICLANQTGVDLEDAFGNRSRKRRSVTGSGIRRIRSCDTVAVVRELTYQPLVIVSEDIGPLTRVSRDSEVRPLQIKFYFYRFVVIDAIDIKARTGCGNCAADRCSRRFRGSYRC